MLLRHHRHFAAWHGRWLARHVSAEAAGLAQDWLMGEAAADLLPCTTLREPARLHGLPVTRYRVHFPRRPASP